MEGKWFDFEMNLLFIIGVVLDKLFNLIEFVLFFIEILCNIKICKN